MPTLERWSDLSIRLGATSSMVATFQEVIAAYSESTRAYHTVAHVDECLREFDLATHLAEHPEEVEAGIWFHDAVYDTHRHDNEERAANWAAHSLSAAGVSESVASRVATLVLATSHVAPPVENDAGLLVDVDLSVLGREPAAFDEYEHQIRVEYSWVPDEAFRSGRAKLLESLLRRPGIYHTESFGARYESRARANLKRSLERLRAKAS